MARRPRPPSAKQAATLRYLRAFGRTRTATPTLRQMADALGAKNIASANDCVTALIKKGFLEKKKATSGYRQLRVVGEPEIPVILATERIDPLEPLVDDSRIVETMRGVLGEAFKPMPDFMVILESESGSTTLVAVCGKQAMALQDGTTILGRLGDEIVVGRIKRRRIELESGGGGTGQSTKRIRQTDPNFRIEGVVIGTVTAQAVRQGE